MIEEKAMVTRIAHGRIWLKSQQASACNSCCHHSACGTATLAQAMPKRELEAECDLPLAIGDQVNVAIDGSQLLLGSFMLYIAPLLVMFTGVIAADAFLPETGTGLWLIPVSLLSLLAGFRLIKRLQPVYLRKHATFRITGKT